MGICTSTVRHRQKQRQQQHNQATSKNPLVLDLGSHPPVPPLPLRTFSTYSNKRTYCLARDFDILPLSNSQSNFHQTDSNSLIQLYSSNHYNSNNNNNNNNNNNKNNNYSIINLMSSSSSSSVAQVPPRIPVPKPRLPLSHPPQIQQTNVSAGPTNVTSTTVQMNPSAPRKPMSITNRPPPPNAMHTRFGFIPRPTVPGLQQAQASTLASRSRSISPTSHATMNSSSSSLSSQRIAKVQAVPKTIPTQTRTIPSATTIVTQIDNTSRSKAVTSPRRDDSSTSKLNTKASFQAPTTASRLRSRTPSRTSSASSPQSIVSSPPAPVISPTSSSSSTHAMTPLKTDVDAIRDRYKTQKRMNFFSRHTPILMTNGSPAANSNKTSETLVTNYENNLFQTTKKPDNNDNKVSIAVSRNAPADTNKKSSSVNQHPSAHLSQGNKHRQRAISMLSSASAISDVLNQDTLLEDDNCSLKSDDLMCDYDDTLTIDSTSKTEQIDLNSLASISAETNKNSAPIVSTTPAKILTTHSQTIKTTTTTKENPLTAVTKFSTGINDKTNASLRESLDELNRLSNRIDQNIDGESHRKTMTRSVSLKPPLSYLPPLEDAEQIIMDIESYRQVMKDVTVVKTILHQLDRLLKHSDGANMTDSMIGSFHEFHESMSTSRRFSSNQVDVTIRNTIDENSSYEDLLKEITALRKEKEQDKQTIKLLQEQMYKYSSQTS